MAAKQRKEAQPVPPAQNLLTNPIDLLEQSLAEIAASVKVLGEELERVLLKNVEPRVAEDDGTYDDRSTISRRLYHLDLRARSINEHLNELREALDPSIL